MLRKARQPSGKVIYSEQDDQAKYIGRTVIKAGIESICITGGHEVKRMNIAKVLKLGVISLLAGILITLSTPILIPATVNGPGDLDRLRFGWPFTFLHQRSSLTPPDWWFPNRVGLTDDPMTFLLPQFWASTAFFAVAIFVFGLLVQSARTRKVRH